MARTSQNTAGNSTAQKTTGDATAAGAPPAKRPRTEGITVPRGLKAFHHVDDWFELHKTSFAPPVCNRLMHKGQLSVMFVGAPNTRKDFHLEEGTEFFYQIKGDIELPTVQQGKRKLVQIKEGQVFCLPSRIPHSPQRPNPGSFGLVIERQRQAGEMDGIVFYETFEKCEKVRWEKFFRCEDLVKDLPPVIQAYKDFDASAEAKKPQSWPESNRPLRQDVDTVVPPPFFMADFLKANVEKLGAGEILPLLGRDHPDKECKAMVVGGPSEQPGQIWSGETWLYQLRGRAQVAVRNGTLTLEEGCCCVVDASVSFDVTRPSGSVGLSVRMDPQGNKSSPPGVAPPVANSAAPPVAQACSNGNSDGEEDGHGDGSDGDGDEDGDGDGSASE